MADLFRSAFSYISSGISGSTGENERGGELVGEIVELGELKLKVKKVIAEGKIFIRRIRYHFVPRLCLPLIFNWSHHAPPPPNHSSVRVE